MRLRDYKFRLFLMAIALIAVVIGFNSMILNHLPSMFLAPEEDMDYAWFVPLFSLAVIWMERQKILNSISKPSFVGALATIPFLFIGLLGVRGLQVRFELLAFVGLLVTIPWALFGKETAKRLLFPVACLLFCMPMASFLAIFTVPLRLVVSSISTGVLSLFGMDIVRHGNVITLPNVLVEEGKAFSVGIADPCSGLRSIVALIAVSVGYGYFTQTTWPRRAILLISSVPIAVLCNIIRIMSICLIARFGSTSYAIGEGHDFLGFIVFGIGIYLTVLLSDLINKIPLQNKKIESEDDISSTLESEKYEKINNKVSFLNPLATVTLIIAVMAFQILSPKPKVAEAPKVDFVNISSFDFEDVPPSEAELKLLVGAELGRRKYIHKDGFWFQVSKVVSGASKSSLHRPELCLPSQGHDLGSSYDLDVGDVTWKIIPLMSKTGEGGALFAYTFFNQTGLRTSSHIKRIFIDVWDRTVYGRIDRWAMLTVLVPTTDKNALNFVLNEMNRVVK